jgi:hypothetical protein
MGQDGANNCALYGLLAAGSVTLDGTELTAVACDVGTSAQYASLIHAFQSDVSDCTGEAG